MATRKPKQVERQIREAEAIQKRMAEQAEAAAAAAAQPNGQDTQPAEGEPSAIPEPTATEAPAEAAPESSNAPQPTEESVDWEARYKTLEGKYNSELPQMRQQLDSTQLLLASMQADATAAPLMDHDNLQGLTEQEVKDYGPELIDVIRRAAAEVVSPVAKQLEEQRQQAAERYQETSQQVQDSARQTMMTQLQAQVPDWAEINQDKGFIDWLRQSDVLSGRTRQELLVEAFENNDFSRVKAFFEGYKDTLRQTDQPDTGEAQQNALETLVTPGRPSNTGQVTGASQSGKIWTQQEIQAAYAQRRAGQIPDKQWQPIEADIFAAQRENRIRF